MSWFKRLCLFLFGLAGLVSLVALSLTWVGPWTTRARSMLELPWYLMTLEICVLITLAGLLICLLLAIFYPRNPKETIVADVEGGKITVTRHAIVSQVRHIIESDGVCKASSIRVKVRKHGNVRVSVRVKPYGPIDVIAYGERLYARLNEGLAEVCGDSVKSIDVVFTEPQQLEQQAEVNADGDVTVTPTGTDEGQDAPGGISLHMPSFFSRSEDKKEDADVAEAPTVELENAAEAEPVAADAVDTTGATDATDTTSAGPIEYSWDASSAEADDASDSESANSGTDTRFSLELEEV